MKKWFKKNIISIIFGVLSYLPFHYAFFINRKYASIYPVFLLIITFYFISNILPKGKFFNYLKNIFSFPFFILLLSGTLIKTFYVAFLSFGVPFFLIFYSIKYFPESLININYNTKLYLFLFLTSAFTTLYLEKIMSKVNNLINNTKDGKTNKKQLQLALVLINRNRIRFIIYSLFLIYLIVYSVSILNDYLIFKDSNVGRSVLQSFLTYLAFDRIIINYNLLNFSFKNFMKNLILNWKEEDWYKNNSENTKS
ncbi:MAG: hypothetical protein JJE55_04410 [Flavobacteriaceae bacterium]|nr:hypothetical protein [Flavobacteriaceae bacterium]